MQVDLTLATASLFGNQPSLYRCRFVFRTAFPFGIAEVLAQIP